MPALSSKTFNIPFSGGAATVVCLFKYNTKYNTTDGPSRNSTSVQYNADGTTVTFGDELTSLRVSVNNGVMTVTFTLAPEYKIIDCRCCLIPGDPFA